MELALLREERHGLIQKQNLTPAELDAIKQLVDTCERFEQLHMRLSWEMVQNRPATQVLDYLYYDHGNLVGYLALDNWGMAEKELVGMVHPDYRCRGIFRTLLDAARVESLQLGVVRLILVCERISQSGQAFVKAVGASYDFAEHEMVLREFQPRPDFDERLVFRLAGEQDLDMIVTVLAGSFGDSEVSVRHRVTRLLQDPTRSYYLATLGGGSVGCGEPVGCLRLDTWDDTVGIYGFGVLPAYQGRGYGRQMLQEAIRAIQAEGQRIIMLDVDVTNTRAYALYVSCGFRIKATYDYYNLPTAL